MRHTSILTADIADSPLASYVHHPVEDIEPIQENGQEVGDKLRWLLLYLQSARNSKFTIGCLLIAIGSGYADGVTMTEYARHWGVGKATVSKHCVLLCRILNLPPSRYMRSEASKINFRLSNRRNVRP